tara:strand:- start:238 stop:441 length:204 start_codon:yes stop_codon:yes gene_type:complete
MAKKFFKSYKTFSRAFVLWYIISFSISLFTDQINVSWAAPYVLLAISIRFGLPSLFSVFNIDINTEA